jgi:hypothetical protein
MSLDVYGLEQVSMLMDQTKRSYPSQEIPEETVEMWAPAWIALAIKFGLPAIRAALGEHLMASRFFPQPSELRERIEAARPSTPFVYVPLTPRRWKQLTGLEIREETFEEVAAVYGREAAKRYRAKVERGE